MKQKINITIDKELVDWIERNAKKAHINFSAMINQILWEKKDLIIENIKGHQESLKKLREAIKKLSKIKKEEAH